MKQITTTGTQLVLLFSMAVLFGCNPADKQTDSNVSNNIIVLVQYKTQPAKGDEAVTELTKLIEKVKQEPHFVKLKMLVDPKDKTNILLYETWSDASYYNTDHMKTAHLQEFITHSRDFLAGPPEITFWKMKHEFKP